MIDKRDLFYKIIKEGKSKQSGLDNNLKPYRIIEYQGKEFKIILEEVFKE